MTRNDFVQAQPRFQGPLVTLAVAALMCVGLVVVASTSASLDRPIFSATWWRTTFGRQCIFVVLGFLAMLFTGRVLGPRVFASPRLTAWCAWSGLAIALCCLLAVLIPNLADPTRGSQRWLRMSAAGWEFGFQPSELAKVAMVAWLAVWLTRPFARLRRAQDRRDSFVREGAERGLGVSSLWSFLPAAGVVGVCVALVGVEDFGTAALLAAIGGAMLLVGGCRLLHLAVSALVGLAGFAVLLVMEPYRMDRLLAFRDPWADARGIGYHSIQSLTTIASGGWFGQGLGAGVQKYGYLPESRTDFIFAVLCEEAGLIGGFLVIGLFLVLVWVGLRTMWIARSRFERLLAFGLIATIGLQAAMNIAVVTVSAPTTGISLPFISAGGSGMIVFAVAAGMLAAIGAPRAAGLPGSDTGGQAASGTRAAGGTRATMGVEG